MAMTMRAARKMKIVLCAPSLKFVQYDEETDQFSGLISKPATMIYQFAKSAFNLSIVTPREEGATKNLESKKLPGCFGMLQQGKADVNLYPYQMPVIDIDNVTQVNASSLEAGTYILSPYSTRESLQEITRGPLDSLSAVLPEIWSLAALMTIAFAWILYFLKSYIYSAPKSEDASMKKDEALYGQSLVYQVIAHLIHFETPCYQRYTLRYVSLLISIFAYLYFTLFSCMITSDKVSTTSIQVYDTYEKILGNPKVQPIWIKNLHDYSQYKGAPRNSPQHKLWMQSLAISGRDKSRPTLVDFDPMNILSMEREGREKHVVALVSNLFASFFVGILCNAMFSTAQGFENVKDLRLKGTLDNAVPSSIYVAPISKLSSPQVKSASEYLMRKFCEGQLLHQPDLAQKIQRFVVDELLQAKVTYNEGYHKCTDFEKLPQDDPETVPLFLSNTRSVFAWWAIGCLTSSSLLIIEHLYHRFCIKKRVERVGGLKRKK